MKLGKVLSPVPSSYRALEFRGQSVPCITYIPTVDSREKMSWVPGETTGN